MSDALKTFGETARGLARNPLGIIALFIVLVYGLGCTVVGLANDKLALLAWHPLVWFLAIFPFVVLGAFVFLVARYHRHLYAPHDFDTTWEFFAAEEKSMPRGLLKRDIGAATVDMLPTPEGSSSVVSVDERYGAIRRGGFLLVHTAAILRERTAPRTGRYRIRVWIESLEGRSIKDIKQVTYRVWDDFDPPRLSTGAADTNFEVWFTVYGEFPIVAILVLQDGTTVMLERYLDLPGRPTD